MSEDLWADKLESKLDIQTPYTLLRDQAGFLAARTKDVVRGEVKTKQSGRRLKHSFFLFAPVIGQRVSVLQVARESGSPYPALLSGRFVKQLVRCDSAATFTKALKEVLTSLELTEAVQVLVADSKASGLTFFLVEDQEVVGETGSLQATKDLARRMIGQDGLIAVHQIEIGEVGYFVWLDGEEAPRYVENRNQHNGAASEPSSGNGQGEVVAATGQTNGAAAPMQPVEEAPK